MRLQFFNSAVIANSKMDYLPLAKFGSERVKGDPQRVKISLHNDANFYRC